MRSQDMVFPFSCWPLEELRRIWKGWKDSELEGFIQTGWKDSERLVLWVVPDEDFPHKKINDRDGFVDYGCTEDISEDAFK